MKYTKEKVAKALKESNGNLKQTADSLQTARSNLSTLLKKFNLDGLVKKEKTGPKVEVKSDAKILVFDIETAPMQVYAWDLWKQDISIDAIILDWYVLCWSAKWVGKDGVLHDALNMYKDYKSGNDCEFNVISSIWELLEEADIAVAHNGKAFDKKKLNAKFFQYGFPEPNYKLVDTMLIAKANFALTSNKLDYITKMTGGPGKIKTDFSLWKGCMAGDKESWDKMVSYCDRDVLELERVYGAIRGWDKLAPNQNMYSDSVNSCNVCGQKVVYYKDYVTQTRKYELFRCESCGHTQRSRELLEKKDCMFNV